MGNLKFFMDINNENGTEIHDVGQCTGSYRIIDWFLVGELGQKTK